MNNFDKLLSEVKNEVMKEPCVKEYFRLKKIVDNDEELKEFDKQMKIHQKSMCENENNDEIYFKEKLLYEKFHNKIESNPIYSNFQIVRKEVFDLLTEIKEVLS